MTLFKLSAKNIKRNFKNYFLYFLSMVFSIMVFYTFLSIQYNDQVYKITNVQVATGFKASAIVLAIFSAIFIWYSNSYFTRKRKKEVGLYSLLGIKKKEIGRMLFYETLVMGMIALIVGIILGSLLSKLFIMILIRLMGHIAQVQFAVVPKAILHTIYMFAIIFIITAIHGYRLIYKFKLIELFKAEKTAEKEPKASLIIAVISFGLIIGGYVLYQGLDDPSFFVIAVLGTLGLVVLGTYGLFDSTMIYIIKLLKKSKRRYYKGTNMIETSQLLYKIKSNARTLATIAVLSATTLTALGTIYSGYYTFTEDATDRTPFSYVYEKNHDSDIDERVMDIIKKHPKNEFVSMVDIKYIPAVWKVNMDGEKIEDDYYVISESNYKEIAEARGINKDLNLSNDSTLLYANIFGVEKELYSGKDIEIDFEGYKKTLKIKDFNMENLVVFTENPTLVVKDQIYEEIYNKYNEVYNNTDITYNMTAINITDQKRAKELTKELHDYIKGQPSSSKHGLFFASFYNQYMDTMQFAGVVLFIGVFLGLVFLIATGSIIYFKQLTDAYESKERYNILRKIGVSKREVKRSVSKQTLFVFLLPLAIGICHSTVALFGLEKLLMRDLSTPIILTTAVYSLIYLVYYVITLNSYNKIVND